MATYGGHHPHHQHTTSTPNPIPHGLALRNTHNSPPSSPPSNSPHTQRVNNAFARYQLWPEIADSKSHANHKAAKLSLWMWVYDKKARHFAVREGVKVTRWALQTTLLSHFLFSIAGTMIKPASSSQSYMSGISGGVAGNATSSMHSSAFGASQSTASRFLPWTILFFPLRLIQSSSPGFGLAPIWVTWLWIDGQSLYRHYYGSTHRGSSARHRHSRVDESYMNTPNLARTISDWRMGRLSLQYVIITFMVHIATTQLIWATLSYLSWKSPWTLWMSDFHTAQHQMSTCQARACSAAWATSHWLYETVKEALVTALFVVATQVIPVLCGLNRSPLTLGLFLILYPLYQYPVLRMGPLSLASTLCPVGWLLPSTLLETHDFAGFVSALWRGLFAQTLLGGALAGWMMNKYFPDTTASSSSGSIFM
jgi:hypothetical protein